MNDTKIHRSKKWLSPSNTSYVATDLYAEKFKSSAHLRDEWTTWHYASLKLADSRDIVLFDLDVSTHAEQQKTMKKLDLLVDEITKLNDAIRQMYDLGVKDDR